MTRTCQQCAAPFEARTRAYCSTRCRSAAWHAARTNAPAMVEPKRKHVKRAPIVTVAIPAPRWTPYTPWVSKVRA